MKKHFFTVICIFSSFLMYAQIDFQWAQGFGSDVDFDVCENIIVDADHNVYYGISFYGTIDFDAGPGISNHTSAGLSDAAIVKLDSSGNLIWVKQIGGVSGESVLSMDLDPSGNIYFTGIYFGTVDFDPSPGVYNLTSIVYDEYIEKMDSDGNFIWAKSTNATPMNLVVGDDGSVFLCGYYTSTTDFDPGPGIFNLSESYNDGYIQKLDADGNFIWAGKISSSSEDKCCAITLDSDGNILVAGIFGTTADMDPGAGVFNISTGGGPDNFVLKLDNNGNFIWAGSFVCDLGWSDDQMEICTDNENNIIITGDFAHTCDFDPGPGVMNFSTGEESDMFLVKLDENGNYKWMVGVGDYWTNDGQAVNTDADGNIYVTGMFTQSADFDPGPGTSIITNPFGNFTINSFVAEYDANGNYIWATSYGSIGGDYGRSIALDGDAIYVAGIYWEGTNDFDPGAGSFALPDAGEYDTYITKLKPGICAGLAITFDSVANATCNEFGYAAASGLYGIPPYEYTWLSDPVVIDSFIEFPLATTYDLIVKDANACSKTTTLLIEGPVDLTGVDMTGNITYAGFTPGIPSTLWIDAYNNGCENGTGTISVVLSQLMNYTGASPEPDYISGDTVRWNFSNIVYDSLHRNYEVYTSTATDADLDDYVDFQLIVNAIDDIDTTNDIKDYSVQVVESYDPNNKIVYPTGACDAGYISNTQLLTYTINFQNTGTAEAYNISVYDSLPSKLNINTLHVIASSHEMYTEILESNVLKFVFNDIHLPDSTTNEPESHGYVMYQIKPKTGLADGILIKNDAAIIFDYNDPIFTNETLNTIESDIPVFEYAQSVSICEGETLEIGDHDYSLPGIYIDQLHAVNGCDSILTTTLSIIPSDNIILNETICEGEIYFIGDEPYSEIGTYSIGLINMAGCDSIITLNLDVNPDIEINNSLLICEGESILVGDHTYSETGIYTDMLTNIFGCDSTIITNLTVNPVYSEFIEASICSGETYLFGDSELNNAGVYTQTFTSVSGCDSVVELTLNVEAVDILVGGTEDALTANLAGASYQWIDCNTNLPVEGEINQVFHPASTGTYAVIITDGLCTDTSDCYFAEVLGIDANKNIETVRLYPNPATNELKIEFNSVQQNSSLTILNNLGEMVLKIDQINDQKINIDISNLPSGIYFIDLSRIEIDIRNKFVKE